ncbi:MAG TPA: diacylglycerol kinase family protein [Aeromicrobium sp.]|nr:diacylglycerol kinase family protein [Aeromicrobium sp.]
MTPILMVTNADAGSSDESAIDAAVAILRDVTDVQVAASESPEELDGILRDAGDRTIVVAGGDGSLHAVIAALHRRDNLAGRTLGLLPLGTGNDFARTVNLPLNAEEAAQVIASGTPRPIDLIVQEDGDVVVNSVHAGAGTQASKAGAKWKDRLSPFGLGILGYPIGAAITATKPRGVRLTVEVDGEVIVGPDQQILMVVVGNGASVGGGTELTPDADPSDGYADVMVSLATGPFARFGYAARLSVGRHPARTDVITRRATTVSLRGQKFSISADGEIGGPRDSRTWRVLPAAYNLITGEG